VAIATFVGSTFVGSTFVGMRASRNGAYFLDFDLGGWNHLVIAEVACHSPFRPVVGGGFCVLGVAVSREGGSGGDPSATRNLSPQDDNGDDEPVASG
jgi:hypothetical protein